MFCGTLYKFHWEFRKGIEPISWHDFIPSKSSAVAEMGDCLAKIDIGQKLEGAAVPLSVGGGLGPI